MRAHWMQLAGWTMLGLAVLVGPARADKRDFVYSYQWWTPTVGEHELEAWLTYEERGNTIKPQLEYETGITDRWAASVYAAFEDDDSSSFHWDAFKLENRYRFGEFKRDRLLHAAYAELEFENGGDMKLEAKWLMSLYASSRDNFAANFVVEQPLSGHSPTAFELTGAWNRPVAKNLRAGAEAVAKFSDDAYYLGPNIAWNTSDNSRWIVSVLGGVGQGASDFQLRTLFEYEIW